MPFLQASPHAACSAGDLPLSPFSQTGLTSTYPSLRRHRFTWEFLPSYSQRSLYFLDHTALQWLHTHWLLQLECKLAPQRPGSCPAHGGCSGCICPAKESSEGHALSTITHSVFCLNAAFVMDSEAELEVPTEINTCVSNGKGAGTD